MSESINRGRQYPDGPLEAPPGAELWTALTVNDFYRTEILDKGHVGCYWPIQDEPDDAA